MNKETLQAIKKGSDVLKSIHGSLCVNFRQRKLRRTEEADQSTCA